MDWTKLTRDTKWRDVSVWVPNRVSGRLMYRRRNFELIVALDELVIDASGQVAVERFPAGLRPLFRIRGDWFPSTATGPGGSVNISGGGYCNIYDVVAGQAMSARITGDMASFYAWPSPIPGEEVAS